MSKYADLVARGCTCGGDNSSPCPIHKEHGDNRGLRAWLEAGMPLGFPTDARCAAILEYGDGPGSHTCCGEASLLYPDVDQLDPSKPFVHRPTLICPRCSTPGAETALVRECEAFGIELNDKRIFGLVAA